MQDKVLVDFQNRLIDLEKEISLLQADVDGLSKLKDETDGSTISSFVRI